MNLFVSNLSLDTISEELKKLFAEYGTVVSAKVVYDSDGESKGFAFVEMEDARAAADALDNLDMSFFQGNVISVKEAKPQGGGHKGGKPGGGGHGKFNKPYDKGGSSGFGNRPDKYSQDKPYRSDKPYDPNKPKYNKPGGYRNDNYNKPRPNDGEGTPTPNTGGEE
ncbi:MAG: RNA-binding protein [Chitinophagia bacterium]|nr:RNA-binding protein [Chitinophagia bacterium]